MNFLRLEFYWKNQILFSDRMNVMPKFIDLMEKKFGRLKVIGRAKNSNQNGARWLCECNCGEKKIVLGSSLRGGITKSCGCLSIERTIKRSTKHGHREANKETQIYKTWRNMRQRCTNPNNKYYPNYGGRGIQVCKRWLKFENFNGDMGKGWKPVLQIDRIDNNGNYCKSNCRWATKKQQMRNMRSNHLETYNNKTQCLAEWADETGISESLLRYRLKYWSTEKALITSVRGQKK